MASDNSVTDESGRRRACLVVLSGLPAAGKTTFARGFRDHLSKRNFAVATVCYDELIPRSRQAEMAMEAANRGEEDQQEDSPWKKARASVLFSVKKYLSNKLDRRLPESDQDEADVDLESRFERQCAVRDEDGGKSSDVVVIVDDNNYLRSMRHEYFKLARSLNIGFCQLHFPASPSQLSASSAGRPAEDHVPEEAAAAMQRRMEPPDPGANKWERFSFAVNTFEDQDGKRLQSLPFEMCSSVVEVALSNPESEAEEDPEEAARRQRDRVICNANVIHQVRHEMRTKSTADRALRKCVSSSMSAATEEENKQLLAKTLNEARAELLEDLRTGFASLPKQLVSSLGSSKTATASSAEALRKELQTMFAQKVTHLKQRQQNQKC